ncbi:polyprenyl synthetase family protein [Lactococcus protaetiae]|uniref:Polyprenyl synthetase family protein n=1 Tax=Lactococcus protaetiae TaxID=2592653 RepID=A0A514Z969_9LACT|nr:polyprenyl synthetase family protein [Lactococcus protaetiae]QDK71124.1 polyprenyl synthetase family protein [Lactococcus protaetiae]
MDVKNTIWKDYPVLGKQLSKVQKLMKSQISIKNESIKSAIFDIFDAGGKMLRPAYLLLFADFTELDEKEKLALAASVEMLHTATLVHDDVVDKATTRRGVATISAKYGSEVAVYAGDYLFVAVFKLMSEYSLELTNLTKNLGSIERLLGGELGQLNKHFDLEQSLEDYIENISGKTGELFAMSASIAPLIAKKNRLSNLSYKIGMNIGIAFQIMDDYLDYASTSGVLGKPVLEDIRQGIYSAPVLFALREDFNQVSVWIKDENFEAVDKFIKNSQALIETKNLAKSYTTAALELIEKLPKSENREMIKEITRKLLERTL